MISNLRAKPVQGFVTDSAGNVLRNSNIVIYRNSPTGLISVDRTESDDEGYFVSAPLPNGTYDVFESGIRTARVIHRPDSNAIQCFKASEDNYYPSDIYPFSSLTAADEDLNKYKYFLQIEPENISVDIYGNLFPIYDLDFSGLQSGAVDFFYMQQFFGFDAAARITIPRFDVEFYLPQTETQSSYRRIKWAGIPGIRFKDDSKIVVPLDYYSIVANSPFIISNNGNDFATSPDQVYVTSDGAGNLPLYLTIEGLSTNDEFVDIYTKIGLGDILKLKFASDKYWYGIVRDLSSYTISLTWWKSSRFQAALPTAIANNEAILGIQAFHGIFQGMAEMSETVSDYFNVVENLYQQNVSGELYTYEEGV